MNRYFLLWLEAGWLTMLALGYIVVRREVFILDARTKRYSDIVPDGLEIGAHVPKTAGVARADLFVFLFGDCDSCHELADDLNNLAEGIRLALVVGEGAAANGTDSLLRKLPKRFITYTGMTAQNLANAFRVHSGPLGIAMENDVVVAKGYLRHAQDVERVMAIKTTMPAGGIA